MTPSCSPSFPATACSPAGDCTYRVGQNDDSAGSDDERRPRRLSFAGSIHAEPDLSERTGEYLTGFGQA